MKARDIMTPNPFTVTPSDTVRHAAELMRNVGVGAVLVVSDDEPAVLTGIITDRDIVTRCTANGHESTCSVKRHMTEAPLMTVRPEDDVETIIAAMENAQVRRVPVVSDSGSVLGVVAQADVATRFGPASPWKVEELLEKVSASDTAEIC